MSKDNHFTYTSFPKALSKNIDYFNVPMNSNPEPMSSVSMNERFMLMSVACTIISIREEYENVI